MAAEPAEVGPLLTPGETAALFGVDVKTLTRWARDGRIGAVRTLGGHRRYREAEVRALLKASEEPAHEEPARHQRKNPPKRRTR